MGIKSNIGQSLTNDNVGIGVVPVAGTNKLQVEGNATVNGNVGIGTATPTGKLQIDKPQTSGVDFTNPSLKLTSITVNNEGRTSITFPTSSVDLFGFSVSSWRAGTSGADGKFEIASHVNNATGVSRFIIDQLSGNLGIGTTAPTEKLQVNGKIKATSINFTGLPTSPVGLQSGDVWSNAGILTIV